MPLSPPELNTCAFISVIIDMHPEPTLKLNMVEIKVVAEFKLYG